MLVNAHPTEYKSSGELFAQCKFIHLLTTAKAMCSYLCAAHTSYCATSHVPGLLL